MSSSDSSSESLRFNLLAASFLNSARGDALFGDDFVEAWSKWNGEEVVLGVFFGEGLFFGDGLDTICISSPQSLVFPMELRSASSSDRPPDQIEVVLN